MPVTSSDDRFAYRQSDRALDPNLPEIRSIDLEALWRWPVAGWGDITRIPHISLAYGAVFAAIAVALLLGLTRFGLESLILAFAGGFLLIGPVLAAGLYEGSRRLELGQPVGIRDIALAAFRAPGQLALLGLTLMLIYMAWIHTALLLFLLFMGTQPFPPIQDFIPSLLLTTRGVAMLSIGSVEGALLAALVFAISAVSAPMLIDRPVGATKAILTSLRAVQFNLKPMALWAALVAACMVAGLINPVRRAGRGVSADRSCDLACLS
jgi:uncharacterized membrane protein